MRGGQLTRIGFWVLFVGVLLIFAGPYLWAKPSEEAVELTPGLGRHMALAGAAIVVAGHILEYVGSQRRGQCRTCGRRTTSGSIFCSAHQRELAAAARNVRQPRG